MRTLESDSALTQQLLIAWDQHHRKNNFLLKLRVTVLFHLKYKYIR